MFWIAYQYTSLQYIWFPLYANVCTQGTLQNTTKISHALEDKTTLTEASNEFSGTLFVCKCDNENSAETEADFQLSSYFFPVSHQMEAIIAVILSIIQGQFHKISKKKSQLSEFEFCPTHEKVYVTIIKEQIYLHDNE